MQSSCKCLSNFLWASCFLYLTTFHRHLRNIDYLSFFMCRLLALVLIINRLLFFFFFFHCGHLQNYWSKQGRRYMPLSSLYYLDVYANFSWTPYKFIMSVLKTSFEFLRTSYECFTNFLWANYKSFAKFSQMSYKLLMSFLLTLSYKLLMNSLQISYECLTNFLWVLYKLLLSVLQTSYEYLTNKRIYFAL
jgi:hypothetical protein